MSCTSYPLDDAHGDACTELQALMKKSRSLANDVGDLLIQFNYILEKGVPSWMHSSHSGTWNGDFVEIYHLEKGRLVLFFAANENKCECVILCVVERVTPSSMHDATSLAFSRAIT